jgi:hypothetical protein
MKKSLLFAFLCLTVFAQAQYTWISDRRFFGPEDLIGYDFIPNMMEPTGGDRKELNPRDFSFGISNNNLYVEGEGIRGVYNINNIQPEEYGFKLLHMNARDARLQGHLKVILNKWRMVESLIFKRSPDDKEIIFYLSPIPTKLNEIEKNYFTDRGELSIEHSDSLWGKKFYPFLCIHKDANVQQRLHMNDSASVSFVEVVSVEEKESKKKKSKEDELNQITSEETSPEATSVTDSLAAVEGKRVKITREQFVIVRSFVQFKDGSREDKTWKYPVKKVVQREDEKAGLQEERYQWEFITDKEQIYLYLNGDKTVSTFEVGDKIYLMRGF